MEISPYLHDLSSKIYWKFLLIKISLLKHNNEKLQPMGLIKNGVLQVLSSWENQTVV